MSDASGVGKPEAKGMGVVLADFNNDGWPDIAIANRSWPNFLFINKHNGTFEDVSLISGIDASEDGRYAAGMGIDAVEVDGDGWTVQLIGTKSNRDGIGASLKLSSQGFVEIEQAWGWMSYMSASDPRIPFGLGKRTKIDSLEITSPSWQVEKLPNLSIDQIIAVKEGVGAIPCQFPRIPGTK